ncbi:hypothetical protein Drorol1_Dr00002168 [Drosera rotundifolia]
MPYFQSSGKAFDIRQYPVENLQTALAFHPARPQKNHTNLSSDTTETPLPASPHQNTNPNTPESAAPNTPNAAGVPQRNPPEITVLSHNTNQHTTSRRKTPRRHTTIPHRPNRLNQTLVSKPRRRDLKTATTPRSPTHRKLDVAASPPSLKSETRESAKAGVFEQNGKDEG